VKNPRHYPADEYAQTVVLDESALTGDAAPPNAAPPERPGDKTEELRKLSVQDIERLLKQSGPTKS
jgi:hypothetical protein